MAERTGAVHTLGLCFRPGLMFEDGTTYLYGDSERFTLHFDVLETLRGLTRSAGEVGRLFHEVEQLRERLDEFSRNRDELSAELLRFGEAAGNDLLTLAEGSRRPELAEHGLAAKRAVDEVVSSATERYERDVARETRRVSDEVDQRSEAMRRELIDFLETGTFRVETPNIEVRVDQGGVRAAVRCGVPVGITVAYEIDVKAVGWSEPRQVSSLVESLELLVGYKKKLLRREPVPERVKLEDYYVMGLRARSDALELELARRLDEPSDRVAVRMHYNPDVGLTGSVTKRTSEAEPVRFATRDMPALEALWDACRRELVTMWEDGRKVRSVRSDGEEPGDPDAVMSFYERLISEYRPIVRELAAHGANDHELSLKIDRGMGRREELYVSRDELCGPLLTLPEHLLQRLAFFELLPPGTLSDSPGLLLLGSDVDDDPELPIDVAVAGPIEEHSESIPLDDLFNEHDVITRRYRSVTLAPATNRQAEMKHSAESGPDGRPIGVVSGVVSVG